MGDLSKLSDAIDQNSKNVREASTAMRAAGEMITALRSENAALKAALEEGCKVLESNTTAIVDTVWVSDGRPETLLDHFRAALAKAQ